MSKGPVKLFAQGNALSKMVSVMEKLKTEDPQMAFKNRILVLDGQDRLESLLTH